MTAGRRNGPSLEEKIDLILSAIQQQNELLASLVRYLRDRETRAIKRKNTLHTQVENSPLVRKYRPTEAEVQEAVRNQLRREAGRRTTRKRG